MKPGTTVNSPRNLESDAGSSRYQPPMGKLYDQSRRDTNADTDGRNMLLSRRLLHRFDLAAPVVLAKKNNPKVLHFTMLCLRVAQQINGFDPNSFPWIGILTLWRGNMNKPIVWNAFQKPRPQRRNPAASAQALLSIIGCAQALPVMFADLAEKMSEKMSWACFQDQLEWVSRSSEANSEIVAYLCPWRHY